MREQATSARVRWRSRLLVVAVAGAALATVAPTSVAPGSSGPRCEAFVDSCIFLDRNRVEGSAKRRIGRDFACAVTSKKTRRRPRKLFIYVTSKRAMRHAERVRWGLIQPGRARVRLTLRRYRAETMRRIHKDVDERMPPVVPGATGAGDSGALSLGSPIDIRRCPPVSVTIEPRRQASQAMERWAADSQRRHGRDRVAVERAVVTTDDSD